MVKRLKRQKKIVMLIKGKLISNNKLKYQSMRIKREINLTKKRGMHFHMAKKRLVTSKLERRSMLHLYRILNI